MLDSLVENDFESVSLDAEEIKDYCELYRLVMGNTEKISFISNNVQELISTSKELEELGEDSGGACYNVLYEGDFYISYKLSNSLSNTILGQLLEGLKGISDKESSDWVAHNVEYFFGEAASGDDDYVIHADSRAPFSEAGAYHLHYFDTNETVTVTDNGGFERELPIYQLVSDPDSFYTMQQEWSSLSQKTADLISQMQDFLNQN